MTIKNENKIKYYPLTHAQKRIYYDEKKYPGTSMATQAFIVKYKDILDHSFLKKAIHKVIMRNEGFRLRIVEFDFDPEPYQYVSTLNEFHLEIYDFSEGRGECRLREWLKKITEKPIQLIDSDLFFFAYLKYSDRESGYYLKFHHIASDGASYPLIFSEIDKIYQQLKAGNEVKDVINPSYIGYITEEREYLQSSQFDRDKQFWQNHLFPLPNSPELSQKRVITKNVEGNVFVGFIPVPLFQELERFGLVNKTSFFKILTASLAIYAAKVTGQSEIAIAAANHNRISSKRKKTVGMFVSTMVFKITYCKEKYYQEYVKKIGQDVINFALKNHPSYPFNLLINDLKKLTDEDTNHLLDLFISSHGTVEKENYLFQHIYQGCQANALTIHVNYNNKMSNGILELEYEYQIERFSEMDIKRLHQSLVIILSQLVSNKKKKLKQLEFMSNDEKKVILSSFNNSLSKSPEVKNIIEAFETMSYKKPDNIALICKDKKISYKELQKGSTQFSQIIKRKGINPGDIIGIMCERSMEMVLAIIATLRAGGIYLPIDPDYPLERIGFIFKDSSCRTLITRSDHSKIPYKIDFKGEVINLDLIKQSNEETIKSSRTASLKDSIYIIYTSGSTGRPKGVLIRHESVANLFRALNRRYPSNESDVFLFKTTFTFDVSISELFGWFWEGGRLNILENGGEKDPISMISEIRKECVSCINFVPSMFKIFIDFLEPETIETLKCLRFIFLAGEAVESDLILKFQELKSSIKIENLYGPTEVTVYTTCFSIENRQGKGTIPIGRPLEILNVYIICKGNNNVNQLQHIGLPGELYISGIGLASGYINSPQLTWEKFLSNPFSPGGDKGSTYKKMYRTGDLGRWLQDGNIEFLGRIDRQVKIRGFRIESGEIENRILGQRELNIKNAIVMDREDTSGEKYLCAYLVADNIIDVSFLQRAISKDLPEYMIPAFFVQIGDIPYTHSGKLDRSKLPNPKIKAKGEDYSPPINEFQKHLVKIWSQILRIDQKVIGIDDDFFKLGGHSLKAAILTAVVHKKLNIKLLMHQVFRMSTIRKLANYIKEARMNEYFAIAKAAKKDFYVLSPGQKRLFILDMMEGTSITYNMPMLYFLDETPDCKKLEESFKKIIARQESFRTSFKLVKNQPQQKIHQDVCFEIECHDFESILVETSESNFIKSSNEHKIEEIMRGFVRPFNLSNPPLLRAGLLKIKNGKSLLMIDVHHIIADGMSFEILKKELITFYEGEELYPLNVQYRDFSEWQDKENLNNRSKDQENYWLNVFSGEIPVLNLPLDFSRPLIQSFEGDTLFFMLNKDKCKALKKVSTLFMIFFAAFNILLWKLTGQMDIVMGTTVACRTHPDLKNIIGMFVNTLALRFTPKGSRIFMEFLNEVKKATLEAFENQNYPFEELVEKLKLDRDASRNPLFDVMFTFQVADEAAVSKKQMKLKPYKYRRNVSRFDLTLFAEEREDGVFFELEYCTKLFARSTIKRFIGYYMRILDSILNNPFTRVYEIEIMAEKERKQILYEFNDTENSYPADKLIQEIFESQVEKSPDNISVIFDKKHLSYLELNRKSNHLAHILRKKGVTADSIVTLIIERSLEMMIGIYGILKAGGAYLPIEPSFPKKRIEYLLKDSNKKLILTVSGLMKSLEIESETINIEEISLETSDQYRNPVYINTPKNIAYIIYTSGSTGLPKGVMIQHLSVINRINWMQKVFPLSAEDVILHKTTFVFDVSVWELFWWAFTGASQYLLKAGEEKDPSAIMEAVEKYNITTMHFVPSMLSIFLANVDGKEALKRSMCLRQVFASGEALPLHLVEKFNDSVHNHTGALLINLYGPTEATVDVTCYRCPVIEGIGIIPIGKPIDNVKLYILDFDLSLQIIGVAGELCISGIQLARGYLNKPDLTARYFIENPFKMGRRYSKLYRTGDLCRWMPGGNIEYLSRIDQQVKIRGFRIETGEIENCILRQNELGIKETAVIVREDKSGEKYLCAYIVSNEIVDRESINEALLRELPEYMIPSYFMQLDEITLTASGKTDRNRLPVPQIKARGESFSPPRNLLEEKLVGIWSELLHIKSNIIGIDDDFFKLGGHSLKAAILITLIHKRMEVKVSMHHIFDMPTVRKLARFIKETNKEDYSPILPVEKREYYIQTPQQRRLFFLDQLEKNSTLYNMQLMDLYCKGFERVELEDAIKRVIKRHESLRTSFFTLNGEAVQRICDYEEIENEFKLEYYEGSEDGGFARIDPEGNSEKACVRFDGLETLYERFVRPFDLSKAPLLRVGLVRIWGDTRVLIADMHHIISDGISMVILLKELWDIYGEEDMPALRIQYKDFSHWLNKGEQKMRIKRQEEYWMKHFCGDLSVLSLPYDYIRPAKMTFEGDMIHFGINRRETNEINKISRKLGVTVYMILLSIYKVLLAKLSGQEEVIVGTGIAGRGHADLQPIIGMFVETLVLRTNPRREKSYKEFLKEVKMNVLAAFENQEFPLDELVRKVAPRVDMSRNPLFDVVFLMENEAERSEEYLLQVLMVDRSNPFRTKKSKFDLTLLAAESGDELHFNLEYNVNLFSEKTIDRFIGYYKKIVTSICKDVNQKIEDIEIIPTTEEVEILHLFSDTEADYPEKKRVHVLFEEQVERTPDAVALVGNSIRRDSNLVEEKQEEERQGFLTYSELNKKANQLANMIHKMGIKTENLIAVMMEQSKEMIEALLAVLKADGAFLPLEYKNPKERIKYMLEDSKCQLFLTRRGLAAGIDFGGEIITLDDTDFSRENATNINSKENSHRVCYVIYTSGSTGRPKGVLGEHHSLINLSSWYIDYFEITAWDHATKYASLGFDASVWEIFPPLLKGAALFIVPEKIKLDIEGLNRFFEKNNITVSFLPTQMAEQFMGVHNTSLRILQAAGDKLKSFISKNYRIYNCYGPTENTVCATAYHVLDLNRNIPIGKPIYNNRIYIISEKNHLQPIGVPGELCVGGASVARGYMNNPHLTAEKFIPNPFPLPIPLMQSPRLYRTGDIARWLNDGNIEFLGRIDYQVKIRGYRIELGEIENQLLHIDEIDTAIIMVREDKTGQKNLCAYIVLKKEVNVSLIKKRLERKLPDYMIPAYFILLDRIPLSPSGKIDRGCLPEPVVINEKIYTPPETKTEKILVRIWSQVLGLKEQKISIDDNFFQLGGDSIKVVLISARLQKYNMSISINEFFLKPTIREAAKQIRLVQREIHQGVIDGPVALTPIQKWFFTKKFRGKNHFNHMVWIQPSKRFDKKILKQVFIKILEHHDALRMVFKMSEDGVLQRNRGIIGEKLLDMKVIEYKNDSDMNLERMAERINRSIRLSSGPLLKLCLFRTKVNDLLLIVVHHLVIDGISWRILLEDFENGYEMGEKGMRISFPNKTDSFKYWASRLKDYAESSKALKELEYWGKINQVKVDRLSKDYSTSKNKKKYSNRAVIDMHLNRKETDIMLGEINRVYNTEVNDILLTALGMALFEWKEMEIIGIQMEGHGREPIMKDINISRTIGWFTSQYPLVLDMKLLPDKSLHSALHGDEQVSYLLQKVKKTLRQVPNKGIGYGILKYLTSPKNKKKIPFDLKPEISFNFHGKLEVQRSPELTKPFKVNFGDSFSPKFEMDYAIDIIGIVESEGLKFSIAYNINEYERHSIKKFVDSFKKMVLKIIDHCQRKKKKIELSGLTAVKYHIKKEVESYKYRIDREEWPDLNEISNYRHILLTGATGFLGSYILKEFLNKTNAKLYLPVRGADEEESRRRLQRKLNFYFGKDFYKSRKDRLNILCSDLSEKKLNLKKQQYENLSQVLDVIVHSAANVKHHGLYKELFRDNVLSTENLIELAGVEKKKDFHFISTLDVGYGNIPAKEYNVFTEYCHDVGQQIDHIYLKSKFMAEQRVLASRKKGIDSSIYRVGNLVFNSETGKFQENIEDDYFYAIIKAMIKLNMVTENMEKMVFDISFIDYTARAVVQLITRKKLKNETYHVCNPHKLSVPQLVEYLKELGIKLNDVKQEKLSSYLAKFDGINTYEKIIEILNLHMEFFEKETGTQTVYKLDRTVKLLEKLGIAWPAVTKSYIEKMIAYCKEINFL